MNNSKLTALLGIPELPTYLDLVEERLEELVGASDAPGIKVPALRVVRNGGKRLRPILVIASALSSGGKINDDVITAACAIELAHVATLVHDDIIDNSNLRRGTPTINSQEGVDDAIIVGDYLLSLAIAQAAVVSQKAAYILASTIATVCEGQMQETNDEYNVDRTIPNYLSTIRKKTGALIAAACRIGGVCASLPDKDIDMLAQYGEAFGMAFQLTDDVLDFLSTTELMGKPIGIDVKEGVYTMPLLLACEGSSGKLVKSWLGKNPRNPATHTQIVDTLLKEGAFDKSQIEIRKYNDLAARAIKTIGNNPILAGLSELPYAYQELALKKQKPVTT
jgi:geranylgeranyl pyrophosphate synthase